VRFLADESCDFAIVRALRSAGFDVAAVVDISPRALDQAVIDMAVQQDRILVTEDKDFGQLVYASGQPSAGVILLRFPAGVRSQMAAAVLELLRRYGDTLAGGFAVVQPGVPVKKVIRAGEAFCIGSERIRAGTCTDVDTGCSAR
jgi:predicted nuclease of predicted toxin-antitoxin system